MPVGLAVADIVNVTVNLTPLAAPTRNFGAALHVGASPVIDVTERVRPYANIAGVASDFGTSATEYQAAVRHFSQVPQPSVLYIGRWAQTATSAVLHGGVMSAASQLLTNFTGIANGTLSLLVDGQAKALTGLNFSGVTNLNGVASVINAALTGAVVTWDATRKRFDVTSASSGTTSTIGYATAPGSGTNLGPLMNLVQGVASSPVAGIAAETLVQALQAFANATADWYAAILTVPLGQTGTDAVSILAAADYIEASQRKRRLGITTQEPAALDSTLSSDIGSILKSGNYRRSFVQFSSTAPQAVASLFGRAATVDFTASKTAQTLKFKVEPTVGAETIQESQAVTLKTKNINVFANYENGTAIIQEGVNSDGTFFDEVHGCDWFENDMQTGIFNLLYTSPTKVPQTDAGMQLIKTVIDQSCERAIRNGFAAPGIWNSAGFGELAQGQALEFGYYVYVPPIATQSQADREARRTPTFQVALKLSGAVHFVTSIVAVNR